MSYSGKQYSAHSPQHVVNAPTGIRTGVPHFSVTELQQAMHLHRQGHLDEAEAIYRRALQKNPGQFECLHYLGLLNHQKGRHHEAAALIAKAVAVNDASPAAHSNLGLALHASGKLLEALASYERALKINPAFAIAMSNRGNVLRDLGRIDEALHAYEKAIAQQPDFPDALANYAFTLKEAGQYAEALKHYDRLVVLCPTADLHNARGCMQKMLCRFDDALASFARAIEMDPSHRDAWNNKAATHFIMGQQQAANDAFDQCLRLDPASAVARFKKLLMRIPAVREHGDDMDRLRENFASDIAAFSQWIDARAEVNPLEVVGAMQPFYLAYQERGNVDLLAPYGKICCELMARWSARHGIAPRRARAVAASTIRVGVVSAHFSDHPVWTAIVKGWFLGLDKDRFELHAFDLGTDDDAQTAIARDGAAHYHRGARPVLEWARLIVESDLDVLIYPELGMDPLTAQLASMRLARKQAVSWGHPETTGLPTMDVYLSAAAFEDANAKDHYTERLIGLPHLGCYYDPPAVVAADVDPESLGVRQGAPLFICAGSPFKYAPENDHVFVEIAQRLPDAQFVFFTNPRLPALSAKFQTRIAAAFRDAGLAPKHHMIVLPWQSPAQFYGIMRKAHVFLDTIGFSGFNTAMQAVDCALPIVTVEGRFMRGRFASAILKRIGLDELVHGSKADYVESAVRLATDVCYRNAMQSALRTRRELLYRDTASIRAFEDVLERLCTEDAFAGS